MIAFLFVSAVFAYGLGFGTKLMIDNLRQSGNINVAKWWPSQPELVIESMKFHGHSLKVRHGKENTTVDLRGKRISINGKPGYLIDMEAAEACQWNAGSMEYPDGVERWKLLFSGIVDRIHTANKRDMARYLKLALIMLVVIVVFTMVAVGGVFFLLESSGAFA